MAEGTLRNMAHDAADINWAARKRVEEYSQRAPAPDLDYRKPPSKFSHTVAAICSLTAVGLLAITWVFYF